MRTFSAIVIVLLLLAAAALYMSAFMVRQTEQALLLQFGEVKDVINEYELDSQGRFVNDAGLNWKIPVVQEVIYYDKRVLDLDSQPLEVIVSDQKRLVVDAFLRYRITNPLPDRQDRGDCAPAPRQRCRSFGA